ncbi:MAG: tRNA (N6-threonylcarbamoyladenosine(37)-N6)-methyltransferase TrmO [Thaumarchaeota archaeon]|nr:tRNA (N6-threonylcarbamoyladenosine(37)-N6)-methyltransferase TrmO [Nitrososphaerota archaeon]
MSFQVISIGFVRTEWKREGPRVERHEIVSELVVDKKYEDALDGIDEYSHLFVIFWFHELRHGRKHGLKMRAKRGQEGPLVGIFATRSYGRPNPIGLAVVDLLRREDNILTVRGLDAFDGSPILDIKPYDHLDRKLRIKVPDWTLKTINRSASLVQR